MIVEPIRSILKVHIDPEAKPTSMIKTFRGNIGGFSQEKGIFHPEGVLVLEDLFAGDSINWPFSHAEIQKIIEFFSRGPWLLCPSPQGLAKIGAHFKPVRFICRKL